MNATSRALLYLWCAFVLAMLAWSTVAYWRSRSNNASTPSFWRAKPRMLLMIGSCLLVFAYWRTRGFHGAGASFWAWVTPMVMGLCRKLAEDAADLQRRLSVKDDGDLPQAVPGSVRRRRVLARILASMAVRDALMGLLLALAIGNVLPGWLVYAPLVAVGCWISLRRFTYRFRWSIAACVAFAGLAYVIVFVRPLLGVPFVVTAFIWVYAQWLQDVAV